MSGWTVDDDDEQITQTASYVMEAPAVPNGVSLYALAVVNANGILTVGDDGMLMRTAVRFSGEGPVRLRLCGPGWRKPRTLSFRHPGTITAVSS